MDILISYESFTEQYKPQENHITKAASEHSDHAPMGNLMYETFGTEYDYVVEMLEKEPARVWTVIETDNDENPLQIVSGEHFVNSFGYIITEKSVKKGVTISVEDDD